VPRNYRIILVAFLVLASGRTTSAAAPETQTENVLFVMLDGLRWQEVYRGPDASLVNKERGGVEKPEEVRKRFVRDTADEQRAALMPFLWNVVAKEGQLLGNHARKSVGRVTNGKNFSYPGYSEVLCGFADGRIDSNDKNYNPNVTVLEWLHAKPEFKGKVAAVTSWDCFPFIINAPRSGIPVSAGAAALSGVEQTEEVKLLNRLSAETPLFEESTRPDAITFHAARIYVAQNKPRVIFISFDETDTQAHNGRYDRVLGSANKADAFLRELWGTVQKMPEYRGKTTLLITTDHGRGDPPVEWKNHNDKTAGSEFIWMGMMGPDTPALGERSDVSFAQDQIAATLAALLGYDYCAAVPKAGKVIDGVIRVQSQ
jgi:hypothetical protein